MRVSCIKKRKQTVFGINSIKLQDLSKLQKHDVSIKIGFKYQAAWYIQIKLLKNISFKTTEPV